jgi:hypothetical protein
MLILTVRPVMTFSNKRGAFFPVLALTRGIQNNPLSKLPRLFKFHKAKARFL